MRLATINLLHGRSIIDGLVDPLRVAEGISQIGADIIGLQEVDYYQPRSHNLDYTAYLARSLDCAHYYFAPTLLGDPEGGKGSIAHAHHLLPNQSAYGIGLISRWPVLRWRILRLPLSPIGSPIIKPGPKPKLIWWADEARLVIAADIQTPLGLISVAVTHLSFVPGWNIRQLRIACRALAGFSGETLLLGDLNLPARIVKQATSWTSLVKAPTHPSTAPKVQFDYILRKPHPLFTNVVYTGFAHKLQFSDHRAIVVDIEHKDK